MQENGTSSFTGMGLKNGSEDSESQIALNELIKTRNSGVIEETLSESIKNTTSNLLITCFSKTPDSMLMWSHYADNSQGVCLEFENDDFLDVQYSNKRGKFLTSKVMYKILWYYHSREKEQKSEKEMTSFLIAITPFLTKSSVWSYTNMVGYWKNRSKQNRYYQVYVTSKFGEESYLYGGSENSYISINKYEHDKKETYNFAIIKIQLDEDFVSYQLNLFFSTLLELELIDQDLLDEYIFNTNNKKEIKLIKLGMSNYIYQKLKAKELIEEIRFDIFDNLVPSERILEYIYNQKGFYKFELLELFNL